MGDVHRCAECGYLGTRGQGNVVIEVDERLRQQWEAAVESHPDGNPCSGAPLCYAQAYDLVKEADGLHVTNSKAIRVVTRERECDAFTKWMTGHTPQEHKQMQLDVELRKLRQQEAESQRQWQATEADKQRQFQALQAYEQRRWQLLVATYSIVLSTAIGGAVAIVGYLLGASAK